MLQRLSCCRRLRIVVSVAREVIHFEQQYIDNTYFIGRSHLAYLYFCYGLCIAKACYHLSLAHLAYGSIDIGGALRRHAEIVVTRD